jgi:hypothetical protein
VDGVVSDASRWVSSPEIWPAWLELDVGSTQKVAGIHIFSGYRDGDAVADFVVQSWAEGSWRDLPGGRVTGNTSVARAVAFGPAEGIPVSRLRLWITASHQNIARIREVQVWPAAAGGLPPLPAPRSREPTPPSSPSQIAPLYLNQSGFNLGRPKRFTAPTLAEGTAFAVLRVQDGGLCFTGSIQRSVGNFSAFNPSNAGPFVVEAGGFRSVEFGIGSWWLERVTYQGAVDFMIDARHHVGNDRAACSVSYGWRDDHHFGWELHTLVPQYLSNPSAYDRMPRQVRYEPPPSAGLWGRLEPYREDAPDIVKLIHWGADIIVSQGLTHEHLKAQLAYFLYAWPMLEPWLPAQNYTSVRDFAFGAWTNATCDRKYAYDESPEHDLLAVKTLTGSTKGGYPPGFSIEPNLLMYEVARREQRADAGRYLEAAARQAGWMVENLEWEDPQVTKGQRASEFITMTGLAHLLRLYPDHAPAGLKEKILAWCRVAVRRSDNLWDFRKLDDGEGWVPTGEKRTMWNEVGNVVGLPAALLAVREVVDDETLRARLEVLAYAHLDNMFGRNPVGRHFSYDAPREIEGVEYGWFSFFRGGIGRLENSRFVLDGCPKQWHYPYHPELGNTGWTEGWVQHNVAFNISLAYLARAESRLEMTRRGEDVMVRLRAPLNFDYSKAETAQIVLTSTCGDIERLEVREESTDSEFLAARIGVKAGAAPRRGDGILQAAPGDTLEAAYGFGYMACHAELRNR